MSETRDLNEWVERKLPTLRHPQGFTDRTELLWYLHDLIIEEEVPELSETERRKAFKVVSEKLNLSRGKRNQREST